MSESEGAGAPATAEAVLSPEQYVCGPGKGFDIRLRRPSRGTDGGAVVVGPNGWAIPIGLRRPANRHLTLEQGLRGSLSERATTGSNGHLAAA